jgi:hypothetical protein
VVRVAAVAGGLVGLVEGFSEGSSEGSSEAGSEMVVDGVGVSVWAVDAGADVAAWRRSET